MWCIQWQRTQTKFITIEIPLRFDFSDNHRHFFVLILYYPVKCDRTGRIIYYSDVTWDSFMRYISIWSGNSGAFPDHGSVAPNILLVPLLSACIMGLYDYTSAWGLTITDGGNTINSSPLDKMVGSLADDILICIFMNETFCISIRISLKFVHRGPINNSIG